MTRDPGLGWDPVGPIDYHYLDLVFLPELSATAVTICMARYAEAGPLLRNLVNESANAADDSEERAQGLFRALHVIGEMRDPEAFAPLLRLLRRSSEDLKWLLGDAITETLPKILIGVFDGNADALFEAIADRDRDEFVRDSLLRTAAFLTWEKRIDSARTAAFLVKFGTGELAGPKDFAWHAWIDAIALLGLRHLVPLVEQAMTKDLVDEFIVERDEFFRCLERAEEQPADVTRFTDVGIGYLDNALVTLINFASEEDDESLDWPEARGDLDIRPVVNPMRHVGRNDPCPCGSGKKAKRCCLAA
jgi:hypothetical protein